MRGSLCTLDNLDNSRFYLQRMSMNTIEGKQIRYYGENCQPCCVFVMEGQSCRLFVTLY
jgi:hypothetical protein